MKVGNKILGLAIGQRSILIAEVAAKGQRQAVNRCAEFIFPEGLSLSSPDKLGAALRDFLRSQHFSTKDVIIGLPAKRLVTRRKEVPPAPIDMASATLRLQAEGEFSSELDNLIMDYAGTPSSVETTTVLLMATNKVLVDECQAIGQAAGLKIHAITSTTAALGRATSRLPGGDGLVLNLGSFGAELVIQHGRDPAHLRHLNVSGGADSIPALAAEIRRTMAAIPQNGTPMTLALWNSGTALNPENVLEQRLSIPVTTPEVSNLVVTETTAPAGYASAIALALAALESSALPVDFLHSRLAPPKEPGMSLNKKLGIAGGILVAGLIGYAYMDLQEQQKSLDYWNKIISKNKVDVDHATVQVKRYDEAIKWMRMEQPPSAVIPTRPALFDAMLRDLTTLFPAQGNTIWATDVGCKSSNPYKWEVKGKAMDQRYAQAIQEQMLKGPMAAKFQDVTVDFQRENAAAGTAARGTQNLWSFVLSFTYRGTGYTAPKPPAAKPTAQGNKDGM